ncbi:hypothetical protein M0802_009378 [Mischocyttarus mexicanus]|nr:hypothetical protein M0802_009378 [Mischocyttarus mexicanus]
MSFCSSILDTDACYNCKRLVTSKSLLCSDSRRKEITLPGKSAKAGGDYVLKSLPEPFNVHFGTCAAPTAAAAAAEAERWERIVRDRTIVARLTK